MIARFRSLNIPTWGVPAGLFAACMLSYGLLIPWKGFYWDDMAYMYSLSVQGPPGFIPFVADDRPLSAYVYVLTSALFGSQPLAYHLIVLGLRWLASLAMWWLVGLIWPAYKKRLIWVPFFFAVYPGFGQQSIPFIYQLHLGNLLQTILSLALMVLSLRQKRLYWPLTIAAILLSLNIYSLEYTAGLELLRPFILWVVLAAQIMPTGQRLLKLLRNWAPYMLAFAVYLIWRLVVFESSMYSADVLGDIAQSPVGGVLTLVQHVVQDFLQVGVLPWLRIYEPLLNLEVTSVTDLLYWGMVLFSAAIFGIFFALLRGDTPVETDQNRGWGLQVAALGVAGLLAGGVPFWASLLPVGLDFPYDRWTLAFMLGSSLLLGGLIETLIHTWRQRVILAVVLMAFAVGWNFQISNTYRRDWQNLNTFMWQMAWRAPGIEPGTTLLTYDMPLAYYSDNSLSGVISMAYADLQDVENQAGTDWGEIDYMLFYINDRIGGSLPSLAADTPVRKFYRSYLFEGNTSQSLVYFYSPPGCLRVIDPARPHEYPDMPITMLEAAHLGGTEVILAQGQNATPSISWFEDEPAHGWCYFYEQADLARQVEDWQRVVQLGDEALASDWPADLTELGVFIEGYARAGQAARALELSDAVVTQDPKAAVRMCKTWKYLTESGMQGADSEAILTDVNERYACSP